MVLLSISVISVPVSHICCIIKPYRLDTIGVTDGIEITGYDLNYVNNYKLDFIITIPSEINKKQVKPIGSYAFRRCQYFDELIIPEGMKTPFDYIVIPRNLNFVGCAF